MSQPETWTIGRLLTWTTDYLAKHGAENPRLDAEVLLATARGCERIMLYTAFAEVVSEDLRTKFRDLVKRRAAGVPVAYLVGKKEFYSLSFRVTPDVLIPRPETEHVVVAALEALGAGQARKSKSESPEANDETGDSGQATDDGQSPPPIQNPKSRIQN
jgi:release factor glutamine methyltransferase